MSQGEGKRKRGVVLTAVGRQRLDIAMQTAIDADPEYREDFTLEELRDRTHLNETTIAKVCSGTEAVDRRSLQKVFTAFGLTLEETDYTRPTPKQDYVIWRSLREAPPLDEVLVYLIQFLSDQQETEVSLPSRLGDRLT